MSLLTTFGELSKYKVNGDRLWDTLMEHGKIGQTPKGGVCRLALTELDKQGRDLFIKWAKEAGCSIRIDSIGNIFAKRPGGNDSLPSILVGSHIDTQPTGGKFDGNYGVLAGLEVIRTLNDLNIKTNAPIEVAAWTNEEGSRFVPVMMGSGVFSGAVSLEDAWAAEDTAGISVREALTDINYLGEEKPGEVDFSAYFEVHIEQGPVLEDSETLIGVVPGVLGIRWFECTVVGTEAHAGPTPMRLRRDALQVSTKIMQQVVECTKQYGEEARGTVGMVEVYPNSRNVIPGSVTFSIDLRNINDELVDAMAAEILSYANALQDETGLSITINPTSSYPAQQFDSDCIKEIEAATKVLSYSQMRVTSGAGHDAVYMARLAPTGMIFVPCENGISHNEAENAKLEHLEAGCNVLLQVVLNRAGVTSGLAHQSLKNTQPDRVISDQTIL